MRGRWQAQNDMSQKIECHKSYQILLPTKAASDVIIQDNCKKRLPDESCQLLLLACSINLSENRFAAVEATLIIHKEDG